jgi:histidinol dehydrogenase
MKNKNITIDELAMMVQKGFSEAVKENAKRFDGVDKRFDRIEKKLDRIEKIVLPTHEERIERLEKDMDKVKEFITI